MAQVSPQVSDAFRMVAAWCSDGAAERGEKIWNQGAIVDLDSKTANDYLIFTALVQGRADAPYQVEAAWQPASQSDRNWPPMQLVQGRCTCPVGRKRCKHLAAVLFEVLDSLEAKVAPSSGRPRSNLMPLPDIEPGNSVEDWLRAVKSSWAQTSTQARAPLAMPQQQSGFGYSLRGFADGASESSSFAHLMLTIRRYGRRGRGVERVLGAPLSQARDWEQWVHTAADHRVLTLLGADYPPQHEWDRASVRVHGPERALTGLALGALVQALAETGRCYWDGDEVPLQLGQQRPGELVWHQQADGRLRLGLDAGAGVLCAGTASPVYVDRRNFEMGPLRSRAPATLIAHAHAAPPVTLAQAEALWAAAPAGLQAVLPKPKVLERVVMHPTLVPRMAVEQTDAHTYVGHISFQYGECEVAYSEAQAQARTQAQAEIGLGTDADTDADDGFAAVSETEPNARPWVSVPSADGTQLLCFARDIAAEGKALAVARGLGLSPDAAGRTVLPPAYTLQARHQILEELLAPLRGAGWQVVGADSLAQQAVEASGAIALTAEDAPEGSAWFALGMGIDIGGKSHDLVALIAAALALPDSGLDLNSLAILGKKVFLPLPDGRTVAIPTARLTGVLGILQQLLAGNKALGIGEAAELMAVCDAGDATMTKASAAFALLDRLQHVGALRRVGKARGLKATLRDYQSDGVTWLGFLRTHKLGGVLADDMGLGKTLQVIAHVVRCKEKHLLTGPVLVVAPTGLLANWRSELHKFAPKLTAYVYHGSGRELGPLARVDVVLSSYGVVGRDAEKLAALSFDTVVLDESQQIKNPRSLAHHSVRGLQASCKICLSGTPLQNNLEELWAQFAFCLPALLPNHRSFRAQLQRPIEEHNDPAAQRRLHARIRPFMLRRTKADVVRELPAKTEIIQSVQLATKQAELYETVRSTMDKHVRAHIAARGLAQSAIAILAALLKLRQVCCDGRLLRLNPVPRGLRSAKLEHLLQLLETLMAEKRRVLLFSQFTSMLALIAEALKKRNIGFFVLTGKTANRESIVDAFQRGEKPIFLISLKAGGVGLNLTCADVVIHYDPWWNPAAQDQATDRAHRIGQTRAVFVYKLIVANSVEEKIMQMQGGKRELAEQVFSGGALSSQLTREDIEGLFAPIPGAQGDEGLR